jgi:hypothetical protein
VFFCAHNAENRSHIGKYLTNLNGLQADALLTALLTTGPRGGRRLSAIQVRGRFGSAFIGLERFSEGLIGGTIESGAFAVVMRRLKAWKPSPPEVAEGDGSEEFAAWMRLYRDRCRWQAAKSGPPHEYTIRGWRPEVDVDFERAAAGIKEFGYSEAFYGKTYNYFDLDGLKYWTMGEALADTTVLNRDPTENRYET